MPCHQLAPGLPRIGDERGSQRRKIDAAEDELPHDSGIDEVVDSGNPQQLPVLERDPAIAAFLVIDALLDFEAVAVRKVRAYADGNRVPAKKL